MDSSKLDEFLEQLIEKCAPHGSRENSMTVATRIFEIDSTIRSIDRQLERRKSSILDNLKRYETTTLAAHDIARKRRKFALRENEFHEFETSIVSRTNEIAKYRDDLNAFVNEEEKSTIKFHEYRDAVERSKRRSIAERDDISAEISRVEKRVELIDEQIRAKMTRLNSCKSENALFRNALETEAKSSRRRVEEAREKLITFQDRSTIRN